MNNRERTFAILDYQDYDRLPLVHFGFWNETLEKWAVEGHLTVEEAESWADGNAVDAVISEKLGFDFNWSHCFGLNTGLLPRFEEKTLEKLPDGSPSLQRGSPQIHLWGGSAVSHVAQIPFLMYNISNENKCSFEACQANQDSFFHLRSTARSLGC